MNVKDILELKGSDVETITSDAPVSDVVRILNEKRIGSLVVVDDGKIAGIVSERDILRKSLEAAGGVAGLAVKDIMTPADSLFCCGLEDTVDDVLNVINTNKVRHIPIVEGDSLLGMVSIGDVVKTMLEVLKAENRLLNDYISGKYPA